MSAPSANAVFLSYASQDAAAARRLADALRGAGVEVWLDQDGGLVGGDAWDAKIRGQIATCALFMPIISANTQARLEGYFRIEWKIAAQRTHAMAEEKAFLVPVVIDGTRDADAKVPAEFKAVQWTRLPAGDSNAAFCARVQHLLAGNSAPSTASAPAAAGMNRYVATPSPGRRKVALLWIAAALVPLAGGGAYLALHRPAAPLASPSATADAKSVAVLAFDNMSADKENTEYFSDGISDEITNALDRNPALRVTPRTSAFSFKGRKVPLDEIGRTLGVASVIEGSVKKAGNEVRITVKLLNAATGARVWSEEFVRQLTAANLFAVQGEIAAKVAARLGGAAIVPATSVSVPTGAQTKILAAHDLYLRGLAMERATQLGPGRREIIKLYEEATRLDPDYALAWARLSGVLIALRNGTDRSAENASRAVTAVTTALRVAPHLPEVQLAVARLRLVIDHDQEATARALDEVARLAPNNAEAAVLRAELERARGNWGESLVRYCTRAAELDPQNAAVLHRLSSTLEPTGRFNEAYRLATRSWELSQETFAALRRKALYHVAWTGDVSRALEIIDSAPVAMKEGTLFLNARARLSSMRHDSAAAIVDLEKLKTVTVALGDTSGVREMLMETDFLLGQLERERGQAVVADILWAEALKLAQRHSEEFPDWPGAKSLLARIHAARGEKADALAAIEEASAIAARTGDAFEIATRRMTKAEVLALLGDKDAAIAELRAVNALGYEFGYLLRLAPAWAPLRAEPAFQQLMREAEAHADAQPRPKL